MSATAVHYLKTWPGPFSASWDGRKPYEIRADDRGFREGDHVVLQEYDKDADAYTGREIHARIAFVCRGGEWGTPARTAPGTCVFGIVDGVKLKRAPSPEQGKGGGR